MLSKITINLYFQTSYVYCTSVYNGKINLYVHFLQRIVNLYMERIYGSLQKIFYEINFNQKLIILRKSLPTTNLRICLSLKGVVYTRYRLNHIPQVPLKMKKRIPHTFPYFYLTPHFYIGYTQNFSSTPYRHPWGNFIPQFDDTFRSCSYV